MHMTVVSSHHLETLETWVCQKFSQIYSRTDYGDDINVEWEEITVVPPFNSDSFGKLIKVIDE